MNDVTEMTEEVESHIASLALAWFREARTGLSGVSEAFSALKHACNTWLDVCRRCGKGTRQHSWL
jgi:hypothetical protein